MLRQHVEGFFLPVMGKMKETIASSNGASIRSHEVEEGVVNISKGIFLISSILIF